METQSLIDQKNQASKKLFRFVKVHGHKNWFLVLETGKCLVGQSKCIWHGGIGNYIKTSHAKGTVGCSLYTFDLAYFMSSE